MKKNDVFTFTAPNGVEVVGVVVGTIHTGSFSRTHICYAQNRLFTWMEFDQPVDGNHYACDTQGSYGEILVDYAVLPDYDEMLEDYYHQIDMANDYADKTL